MDKILAFIMLIALFGFSNNKSVKEKSYPVALAEFEDFKQLTLKIEDYRSDRLISFDTFQNLSKEKNTIILDTRSRYHFERKHIKGAINLPFTEFTMENLAKVIPNKETSILIYCNNNFENDPIDFASKVFVPKTASLNKEEDKEIMLALNIPTFINLYGYGYKNIYELDELLNVFDQRVELTEGNPERSEGSLYLKLNSEF